MTLERETAAEITQIEKDFRTNKDKVIDMLVAKVLEVDLSIPSSVKEKFIKKRWNDSMSIVCWMLFMDGELEEYKYYQEFEVFILMGWQKKSYLRY